MLPKRGFVEFLQDDKDPNRNEFLRQASAEVAKLTVERYGNIFQKPCFTEAKVDLPRFRDLHDQHIALLTTCQLDPRFTDMHDLHLDRDSQMLVDNFIKEIFDVACEVLLDEEGNLKQAVIDAFSEAGILNKKGGVVESYFREKQMRTPQEQNVDPQKYAKGKLIQGFVMGYIMVISTEEFNLAYAKWHAHYADAESAESKIKGMSPLEYSQHLFRTWTSVLRKEDALKKALVPAFERYMLAQKQVKLAQIFSPQDAEQKLSFDAILRDPLFVGARTFRDFIKLKTLTQMFAQKDFDVTVAHPAFAEAKSVEAFFHERVHEFLKRIETRILKFEVLDVAEEQQKSFRDQMEQKLNEIQVLLSKDSIDLAVVREKFNAILAQTKTARTSNRGSFSSFLLGEPDVSELKQLIDALLFRLNVVVRFTPLWRQGDRGILAAGEMASGRMTPTTPKTPSGSPSTPSFLRGLSSPSPFSPSDRDSEGEITPATPKPSGSRPGSEGKKD